MYGIKVKREWSYLGFIVAIGLLVGLATYAVAQQIPGAIKITSWTNPFGINTSGPGPTSTFLLASGGTVTCTGGGTPSVSNTNVDAGSAIILTLKTAGGTPAVPIITTITPGTGFSITCGGSDTSVYNYAVIG